MEFKVVVVGSTGSGKTRFIDDAASIGKVRRRHSPMTGVIVTSFDLETNKGTATFDVWDFAHTFGLSDISQHYYGADACIILLKPNEKFHQIFSSEFKKVRPYAPVVELNGGLNVNGLLDPFVQIAKSVVSPDVVLSETLKDNSKYANIHNETTHIQYLTLDNKKVKITTHTTIELVD